MLSVVSYFSLSLMMIIIDIFGPTNSELVECTSLVTSVLFSYYFIESGSEFVAVHILAMTVFVVSFGLSVHNLSQKQTERDRIDSKHRIMRLESTLEMMAGKPMTAASNPAIGSTQHEMRKRTESAPNALTQGND